MIYGSRLERVW